MKTTIACLLLPFSFFCFSCQPDTHTHDDDFTEEQLELEEERLDIELISAFAEQKPYSIDMGEKTILYWPTASITNGKVTARDDFYILENDTLKRIVVAH